MSHHVHHNKRHSSFAVTISHEIQVWYIYTHWSHKYQPNVGKMQKNINNFHGSLMGSENWTRTPSHVQKTTLPLVSPRPPCWKIEKNVPNWRPKSSANKNTGYEYPTQKRFYSLLILCSIWFLCFSPWGSDFLYHRHVRLPCFLEQMTHPKGLAPDICLLTFQMRTFSLTLEDLGNGSVSFGSPKAWFSANFVWVPSTPTLSCSFACHLIGLNGPYRHPNTTS